MIQVSREFLKSEKPKEIVRIMIRDGTQKKPRGTLVINRISSTRDNVKISVGLMDIKRMIMEFDKKGKVRKDKKVKLLLSGGADFDPFGVFDAGPFKYEKRKYKDKKGYLEIKLTIPGTLDPGTYQISLGECLGEVTFTEKQ